jgi:hypothetical protein
MLGIVFGHPEGIDYQQTYHGYKIKTYRNRNQTGLASHPGHSYFAEFGTWDVCASAKQGQ